MTQNRCAAAKNGGGLFVARRRESPGRNSAPPPSPRAPEDGAAAEPGNPAPPRPTVPAAERGGREWRSPGPDGGGGGDPGETPEGRRGGPRLHTKISFGVILARLNPATRRPEAVLVRGRYSYEFAEFVHGRYSRKNVQMVAALFGGMTIDERLDVYSLNFAQMWFRVWLTTERRELYHKKLAKFQSTWMRDDGGEFLRRLVAGGGGVALAAPGAPRWEFPKGRRQTCRETDLNCAVREFEEETGIAKRDYQILPGVRRRLSFVHMGVRYVNVFYVAIARRDLDPGVDLRRLDQAAEVAEVRWLDIEQIRLRDTPTGRLESTAAPVFRHVRRYARGLVPARGLAFRLAPAAGPGGEAFDVGAHLERLQAAQKKRATFGTHAPAPSARRPCGEQGGSGGGGDRRARRRAKNRKQREAPGGEARGETGGAVRGGARPPPGAARARTSRGPPRK